MLDWYISMVPDWWDWSVAWKVYVMFLLLGVLGVLLETPNEEG